MSLQGENQIKLIWQLINFMIQSVIAVIAIPYDTKYKFVVSNLFCKLFFFNYNYIFTESTEVK